MKIRVGLVTLVSGIVCLCASLGFAQKSGGGQRSLYAGAPASANPLDAQAADGFDQLPPGRKGLSMSTLVKMGLVHPQKVHAVPSGVVPHNPLSTITWGAPANTSQSAGGPNEPAAGMNSTNPLYAMISGNNFTNVPCDGFNNTSDGGLTWTVHPSPSPCGYGDGTHAWLAGNINGGHSVLEVSLNPSGDGADLTTGISTDDGNTWANLPSNLDSPFFDDRQYVWTDTHPASPFFGRVYVTEALFDSGGSGSYNTVTVKWSSDGGSTWSADNPLVDHTEFATNTNHNEYPSLAIEPNGDVVAVWHRGACCGVIVTDNKVAWSRSTDGGVTWTSGDPTPLPGTIVDVPLNQTISFNSTSPGGFRWSDTPNVTADPTDGSLYAVWVQYRTANTAASAAVYLSKSTDEGNTWSAPVIPYNDPDPNIFQYMPWVNVSKDHVVHVTYSGGVGNNTTLAHFYVQSTDGGNTWSAPFMLSGGTFSPAGFMGDYQANFIGGDSNGSETIIAGWTDTTGGENQWARLGSFPVALCGSYAATTTPASALTGIYAGTVDTGNHCDDCTTNVTLPFTFTFHGTPYTSVNVDSNGTLQFGSAFTSFVTQCLPDANYFDAILPYWEDQRTDNANHTGEGIFTSVSGNAPNRIFNIEWRTEFFAAPHNTNNYEVRLYEDEDRFDVIYGNSNGENGAIATAGVQVGDGSTANSVSQFSCNSASLVQNLMNTYTESCCPVLHTVGDMTAEDSQQVGRMFRDGNPSACGAPKTCPGPFDAANHSYDIYPMFNGNNTSECVTVSLDSGTSCAVSVFAVAYLGSFDPANICTNYVADSGSSPSAAGVSGGSATDNGGNPTNVAAPFSFDVPPQTAFYIVVNAVGAYPSFCSGYILDVTLPGGGPTAVTGPDVTICAGGSGTLSGSGGVSCSWTPTTGLSDPNSCTPTASPASTTTYTLTVADACGVTSTNNPTETVTVNPGTAPVITPSGPTTFCVGGSVTLDAGAGYSSYLWSPGGQTTQTIVVTASGSYSVTVGGCGSTSAPVVVTVNPLPNAVATGSATTCPGVGVPLTGSGGVSCSWSPTTGLSDPNSCTPIATPTVTTTYTLTVTDANGCSSDLAEAIVNGDFETGDLSGWTIDGTSNPPVNSTAQAYSGTHSALLGDISGPEPLGDSSMYQTINVPASGGTLSFWYWTHTTDSLTFDWQDAYIENSSGTILATIFHQCTNFQTWLNQTVDMSPYAGQTVRIRFLVHQDGFGDDTGMYVDLVSLPTPAQVTVTITGGPTAVAGGGGSICAGGSVGLTGSGGVSCSWSPTTGLSDPNSCTPTASPAVTTTYTLTVTDAGGCQSTNGPTATVTIIPSPAPIITVTHCLTPNTSGLTASVPANAGDTYNWTITGGTIDSGQGTNTISFTSGGPATLMTLTLDETNPTGCVGSTADSMEVNFLDVPPSNPFYNFICTIARHAITAGCGSGNFCPANNVLRSQMAVFLLRGEHGSTYLPPACAGIFTDVTCPSPFANWIEELYNEGITGGCSTTPLMYCPGNNVSRAGMAVFLLVAEHGTGYVPPACSGIFTDVACPSPFANWIEELYNEGITGGCSTTPLMYCPGNSVTRAQMSVFLTVTFALP